MIDGWTPGIGDPTLLGWVTTVAYALAAWLCLRASAATTGQGTGRGARLHRFWLMLAAAMAALALNKQLDLQSLFTAIGRRMAYDEHWYDARRTVQRVFIIAVMLAGGIVLGLLLMYLRRATAWARLAGAGLMSLVAFVVIRAASFHHMDVLLWSEWAGVYIDHLLELGGIAVVATGAAGDRRRASVGRQIDVSTVRAVDPAATAPR